MRKLLASVLVLAALGIVASQAFAATSRSVKIGDNYFVAKGKVRTVVVKKGTRVRWHDTGALHNVVVTRGPVKFRSNGYLHHGDTFSKRVKRAGTYRIVCTIHSGMRMTLKVTR
jgi:plastocyanin